MNNRFLITGLGRCRTAWMSVATSTPRSICYHEPTAHTSKFEDLIELWASAGSLSIGISDSSLPLYLGRILETVKPRTLIIDRPIDEVIESFDDYMMGTRFDITQGRKWVEECLVELDRHRAHPLVRCVEFDALNDHDTVLDCLKWLVPTHDFMDVRFLMTMNIQVNRDYVMGLVARPHSAWHTSP